MKGGGEGGEGTRDIHKAEQSMAGEEREGKGRRERVSKTDAERKAKQKERNKTENK